MFGAEFRRVESRDDLGKPALVIVGIRSYAPKEGAADGAAFARGSAGAWGAADAASRAERTFQLYTGA